jgi:hypothetical protein
MNPEKDKLGYYRVGEFKTYSKVEAIEAHARTGIHPHWHFNEEVFKSYNWRVEPTESLEDLYARRAKEIREKYDYVSIFYSGGADSGNIVNTFVDNGLKIDEIVTYNFHALDPRRDNFFHAEQYQVSYPKLEELKKRGVSFKHKVIDLSDIVYKILLNPSLQNNLAYWTNSAFGITHLALGFVRESDPDYLRLAEQSLTHAFIFGIEKPRIYIVDGKYCIRFVDMIDTGPSIRTQILARDWEHDELFYWAPESCDLICKQGHVLMRFLKKNREIMQINEDIRDDNRRIRIPMIEETFCKPGTSDGLSYREILNWLIYPGFNPYTFSMGKPMSVLRSLRDEYWRKDVIFDQPFQRLTEHLASLDKYWYQNTNNIEAGLKGMISPPYFLE